MRLAATLVLLVLVLGIAAGATTNTFNINYTPTNGQICLTVGCFPSVGSPFSSQFQLTSAQLASDGTYDITSSLSQFTAYAPGPGVTMSLTADAIVSGGSVSAINISFDWLYENTNPFTGTVIDTQDFTGHTDGTWRSDSSAYSSLGPSTSSSWYTGTYTISEVVPAPEPASLVLLGCGALALVSFRKRL